MKKKKSVNYLSKFASVDSGFMKQIVLVCIILYFGSCNGDRRIHLDDLTLTDVDGRAVNVKQAGGNGTIVFLFMSPDCPLCMNYTKTINDLVKKFAVQSITFIPVYPGDNYSQKELVEFQKNYNFNLQSLVDKDFTLSKMLEATVTPQAIVISDSRVKMYSGAIDNWMFETGKKRTVITESYLDTVLTQLVNGKTVSLHSTEPIGCFIEL